MIIDLDTTELVNRFANTWDAFDVQARVTTEPMARHWLKEATSEMNTALAWTVLLQRYAFAPLDSPTADDLFRVARSLTDWAARLHEIAKEIEAHMNPETRSPSALWYDDPNDEIPF